MGTVHVVEFYIYGSVTQRMCSALSNWSANVSDGNSG